jgi:phosphatidylglycerophosphate synthase
MSVVPTGRKPMEAIWTRLIIEPVAGRVIRLLVPWPAATPNRVTVVAGLLALCSAAAFGTGHLVVGAIVFQVRFLVDCLDGRLARIRGTATAWGGALDLIADVVGITLNYAALATYLVAADAAPPLLLTAVVASNGVYVWTLSQRKSIPGGGQHDWSREAVTGTGGGGSPRARLVRFMARHGMVPTPYAVEIEACALTLAPLSVLLMPAGQTYTIAVAGLWLASVFYVVASALNVYRTWRLTSAIDLAEVRRRDRAPAPGSGEKAAPHRTR